MTTPTIYQTPILLPGSVGILPQQKYMVVGDNLATVTTAGYLNSGNLEGATVSTDDILNVLYSYNPVTHVGTFEQFSVSLSGSTITLVALSAAGEITLPTIANHIATYTNTTGHLAEDPATAISGGNIQAGLSGTAGYLASFPSAASKGSLHVTAVANTGDTLTTISNAAMGQASVISIPDPGAATANFVVSASAGTQHITTGSLSVDAGNVSAGLAAGGTAGNLILYPATAANGFLELTPVGNAGNLGSIVSPISTLGQASTYTIPDPGAATANLIISKSAGIQHITTGSLAVDAGTLTSGISTGGTAGGLTLFPSTATNGSFVLTPVGNAGNFAATLSPVSTLGQASVYTIPDPAAATANVMVAPSALVSGNLIKASGTAGLAIDTGISYISGTAGTIGIPYVATVVMNTAAVTGAYATPVQIIAAPGASLAVIIVSAIIVTEASTAFATGGIAQLQYGNTNHAGGTVATNATIAAANITAATSQVFTQGPLAAATVITTANAKNLGIFFTNATGAYTNGAGSTITAIVTYYLVPAV